jgi:hypothetical protein
VLKGSEGNLTLSEKEKEILEYAKKVTDEESTQDVEKVLRIIILRIKRLTFAERKEAFDLLSASSIKKNAFMSP